MVNGLRLYRAFIQSEVKLMPLIHPFTYTWLACKAPTSSSGKMGD